MTFKDLTRLDEATVAYNNDKYRESLDLYKTALASPSGEQLRTLDDIYLASWKLGRMQEAEQAFGKVVELGNIVGHTSRTGGEPYNDKLSAQRAAVTRQKLGNDTAELLARTKTSGMGSRENIIGTGTDDASDSLDRRVEFKIAGC
jgi:OmpA family